MKRINIEFPKPGTSIEKTIPVTEGQIQVELITLNNQGPDGYALEIKFLDGTSEDFPERNTTEFLDGFNSSLELSNGDLLIAKAPK
ncbi:hypothetical protein BGL34_01970 [Fructilactobacillus lindneri]|nr:hypothetical protein [Fructilactobacillus lindneri]ANZ58065.1 hypothetical protein AYR60_04615 [Fructilactobacillus lindneri]ANZ59386.1 hypothetical protein AYR59_04870 [Fructilactobacillus lindneri]POG98830.1 hypothetical protein BGL31_02560 [Fructilactobacillus lindneri]POH03103.1 hypothetical protein BGL33_03995 [Fructilactobacillus lindneri]POH04218.1 hypothetical protein BGL32_02500 [Fructilactobacillus lindneri]